MAKNHASRAQNPCVASCGHPPGIFLSSPRVVFPRSRRPDRSCSDPIPKAPGFHFKRVSFRLRSPVLYCPVEVIWFHFHSAMMSPNGFWV